MTKDFEWSALVKIRKILADLGEDSYVGAAFKGCCDMAEMNLDDDLMINYKMLYQEARTDLEDLTKEKHQLFIERNDLKKRNEELQKRLHRVESLNRGLNEGYENLLKVKNELETEMLILKARLFDSMEGKKNVG